MPPFQLNDGTKLNTSKIFCIHINYPGRAAEKGRTPPHPGYFMKPVSALANSGDVICKPADCELLTFEGEIVLVIGTRARGISPDRGWSSVAYVTAGNDVGIHDMRYADRGSNVRAKGSDGFAPIGPRLLDASQINPSDVVIRTFLNDELVQEGSSDELFFDFGLLVADLSRTITLEPGDLIFTGTPAGASVAAPGDTISVEVSSGAYSTGMLKNHVVTSDPIGGWGAPPRVTDVDIAEAYGSQK